MRTIKFRVYSEFVNKMFAGVNQYGGDEPDCKMTLNKAGAFTRLWESLARIEQDDSCHLMQSTGLTDKNGVDIYEGDIVECIALYNDHHQKGSREILIVKYSMGNTCLCFDGCESGVTAYPINVNHTLEVIGNIHENKDLLK